MTALKARTRIGVALIISVMAHRLGPFQIIAGYLNRPVHLGLSCSALYNEGPSQFSLLSRPNQDCLWGKVISFSLMKPPVWRCCMNLREYVSFLATQL